MTHACLISVSGFSGSGKTTLIEKALPVLKKQGLNVGVLKHTHHRLAVDYEGKDTEKFFSAGADFVAGHNAAEFFGRSRLAGVSLQEALRGVPSGLDLVIVEGYKGLDLPGIWLSEGDSSEPDATPGGRHVIDRKSGDGLEPFLAFVETELRAYHERRDVSGGLLIGGRSSRMGRPKTMLEANGHTLSEASFATLKTVCSRVVMLGAAELPASLMAADRLPDAAGIEGPLSGLISAMRWQPSAVWLLSSVDMPHMKPEAWRWLLSQRRAGFWAVMPKKAGSSVVEATGACYEPQILDHIEALAAKGIHKMQAIAELPKVLTPVIPEELVAAWQNVNTPQEWENCKDRQAT